MKAEQTLEKYLCRRVKEFGGMCIKLTGVTGIPDRLVITPNGQCVFIEMKVDGGRVAPIQQAIHRHLNALHCKVYVLWSYEMVDEFIDDYFGGYDYV